MPDSTEALKDSIADNEAEVDEIAEDDAQSHHDALQALLNNPEGRSPQMWEDAFESLLEPFGVIEFEEWVTLTVVDFVEMDPSPFRAPAWQATMAAATAQANVAVYRDLLPTVDRQAVEQNKAAGKLSRSQLEAVSKEGVGKAKLKAAKDRRKAARDGATEND